ncbi:MAG TPA: hypothetical protein PK637_06485 [Flavobacteriales bacterium]|nr:hypothetical protein [Flavobacteriales bacterium]HRE96394.1 hypothetical protein [Flavobacteriales bacterium]HRJ34470.1 hypothetical protein [Flavobacteriales bacterium]HRJ37531.1 hypothetical protein [Flavobacteriales bacterium]
MMYLRLLSASIVDNLPKSPSDLQPHSMDQEIIAATAQQVIKDFGEFSFEIVFTGKGTSPYAELFEQVLPVVEHLLQTNTERFHALLYRIDVNESLIKRYSAETPGMRFPEMVTDLILRREMMKVLTRRYFR